MMCENVVSEHVLPPSYMCGGDWLWNLWPTPESLINRRASSERTDTYLQSQQCLRTWES